MQLVQAGQSKTTDALDPSTGAPGGNEIADAAQLTSPQTLASMLQLNDDDSAAHGALGTPRLPADWRKKTDAWFDDMAKARQEAKASETGSDTSAADLQGAASRPVERWQMQTAARAYSEASKLSTASST